MPFNRFSVAVLVALSLAGPLASGLPMKMTKLLPQVLSALSGERNVVYGFV